MLAPSPPTRHPARPQRHPLRPPLAVAALGALAFVAALAASPGRAEATAAVAAHSPAGAVAAVAAPRRYATASASIPAIALRVQDGDSFVARLADGRTLRIRIAAIDAPERTQPWSEQSRRRLREALHRQTLQIEPLRLDGYGRTVARVRVARPESGELADVGLMQVESGMAWHFARYAAEQPAPERAAYALAQRSARERQAGLWRDPDPTPPWDFRIRQRRALPAAPARS